jgi:ATP/ADP translocase
VRAVAAVVATSRAFCSRGWSRAALIMPFISAIVGALFAFCDSSDRWAFSVL